MVHIKIYNRNALDAVLVLRVTRCNGHVGVKAEAARAVTCAVMSRRSDDGKRVHCRAADHLIHGCDGCARGQAGNLRCSGAGIRVALLAQRPVVNVNHLLHPVGGERGGGDVATQHASQQRRHARSIVTQRPRIRSFHSVNVLRWVHCQQRVCGRGLRGGNEARHAGVQRSGAPQRVKNGGRAAARLEVGGRPRQVRCKALVVHHHRRHVVVEPRECCAQ